MSEPEPTDAERARADSIAANMGLSGKYLSDDDYEELLALQARLRLEREQGPTTAQK